MDAKEEEFLKRLRVTFRTEAEEHIRDLSAGLIELENLTEPARRAEILEVIFREVHSLKGAARSVSLKDIELICQPLENVLAGLKRGELLISPEIFDLLLQAADKLTRLVSTMDAEQTSANRAILRELSCRLSEAAQNRSIIKTPVAEATSQTAEYVAPATADTVRIPIDKLDPLLLQAEEMIQAKLAAGQRVSELREIQRHLLSWKAETAKRKNRRASQSNELPESDLVRIDTIIGEVNAVSRAFEQDQRALRHMVDNHLGAMKQVLMLPASTLAEIFPRLVRDLARDQGKDINLLVRGSEIEIDKRILEGLKDPLMHLLRNCVDHGIEKPEARTHNRKPERGTITLTFNAKESRQLEILISDDGAGIDVERVRAVAIRSGAIAAEAVEKLNPLETLELIFQSGISTSEIITDISGRGLGLAIVREKTEKLGGLVSVDTQTNVGTTFRLLLPLMLATFRGILVRVRQHEFVLPITYVEHAVRVGKNEIHTVENRETILLDGHIISLVRLGDILALPARKNETGHQRSTTEPVLILASAEKRIAVQVDEVLAEDEFLVKGLGKQLRRVRNIAGATVLGTGRLVPVLNAGDLMNSVLHKVSAVGAQETDEKIPARTGRILVAEDSITARTLLKNILETAGYQVSIAVDGVDAFTQLRSSEFDLVVSDVDMPRMNGFELTVKIRGDKKLGELPVVLVTALESRRDREHGIEAGANAYIIKSDFNQSNLLEVIGRLL